MLLACDLEFEYSEPKRKPSNSQESRSLLNALYLPNQAPSWLDAKRKSFLTDSRPVSDLWKALEAIGHKSKHRASTIFIWNRTWMNPSRISRYQAGNNAPSWWSVWPVFSHGIYYRLVILHTNSPDRKRSFAGHLTDWGTETCVSRN